MSATLKPSTLPLSLSGLSFETSTDPNDTSEGALRARAQRRKQLVDAQDDQQIAPGDAMGQMFAGFNRRDVGGLDQMWAPYDEAVQESGERATGDPKTKVQIGGAPGLSNDTQMGTLPLSLRGLADTNYAYDKQGNPVAAIFGRKQRSL